MIKLSGILLAALTLTAMGCAHKPQQQGDQANTASYSGDRAPASQDESKEGRDGIRYFSQGGNFFYETSSGQKCQITSRIKDFRMVPRGGFVLAYETHDGDLVLLREGNAYERQCVSSKDRKVEVTNSQAPIEKWNIVSKKEVDVTIIALDRSGRLRMYDENGNEVPKLGVNRVDDYKLHPCHGKKGVAFNSKLAFAMGDGRVYTIEPNGRGVLEQGSFSNLEQFVDSKNIDCSK